MNIVWEPLRIPFIQPAADVVVVVAHLRGMGRVGSWWNETKQMCIYDRVALADGRH